MELMHLQDHPLQLGLFAFIPIRSLQNERNIFSEVYCNFYKVIECAISIICANWFTQ